VAVPLSEAARSAVRALVDSVIADPDAPAAARLRWAVGENLHLTMRFLGPIAPARVAEVAAAAAAAAARHAAIDVRLGGAGAFPSPARPRVLWLALADGAPGLTALAATLGDELALRGWDRDERPFRAHLTLARADGIAGAWRAVGALEAAAAGLEAGWTADRLVVYESLLGVGPAQYRPLATALLGAPELPRRGPVG
jgi:RNA 2',3'-cyclic 3'-phosphodiesterase